MKSSSRRSDVAPCPPDVQSVIRNVRDDLCSRIHVSRLYVGPLAF